MRKIICIDFDGVIRDNTNDTQVEYMQTSPIDGSFRSIKKLESQGYTVIIFSARDQDSIYQWLKAYYPPEYGKIPEITNVKPPAIAYIDDRAIRFENNWASILNYFR